MDMIDLKGFRANVGIIVCRREGSVLLGGRIGRKGWQFPQGGIRQGEAPEDAMYRELAEEIGLVPGDVQVLGRTRDWLHYRLPERYIRHSARPLCIGQKQIWFLLRLIGEESQVRLDTTSVPEFDSWRWVDYWAPVREVIFFKRQVYARALEELAPLLFPESMPPLPGWWRDEWGRSGE